MNPRRHHDHTRGLHPAGLNPATGLATAVAGLALPARDGTTRTTTTALQWAIVVWCAAAYLPVRVQIDRETVRNAKA